MPNAAPDHLEARLQKRKLTLLQIGNQKLKVDKKMFEVMTSPRQFSGDPPKWGSSFFGFPWNNPVAEREGLRPKLPDVPKHEASFALKRGSVWSDGLSLAFPAHLLFPLENKPLLFCKTMRPRTDFLPDLENEPFVLQSYDRFSP